jgi:hypothetical protein
MGSSMKAAAALGVAVLLAAGPSTAAADHFAEGTTGSCYAGELASGVPTPLFTDAATLKVRRDGSADLLCRFAVPAFVPAAESYFGEDWTRPRKRSKTIFCQRTYDPSLPPLDGSGTFEILPNGTGTLRCSFPAPPPDEG